MDQDANRPPDRTPDVDTPYFQLWVTDAKEKPDRPVLMEIDVDTGDEVYETRQYHSVPLTGFVLFLISKRNGASYQMAVRGSRPDGTWFYQSVVSSPMTLTEYNTKVAELEDKFRGLFDTQNPEIVPGRHYMLYIKGGMGKKP